MTAPIQLVRKRVIETLDSTGELNLDSLTQMVFVKAGSDEYFTYADTKEIILDMVSSGILMKDESIISTNKDYVDEPEDPEYEVKAYVSCEDKVDFTGENTISSVSSEDFFYNMQELSDGQSIVVELAPEPMNEFDENAVAILYEGKIIGYLERRWSKVYQNEILDINLNQQSVIVSAKIVVAKELDGLKYATLKIKQI